MIQFPEAVYLGVWPDGRADDVARNDARGTQPVPGGPPLTTDAPTGSAEFSGADGVEIPHLPLYGQWADMAFALYCAPSRSVPQGVIACKDDGDAKPPGGWSLEDIERNGQIWTRLYWRLANGAAQWIGGKEGVFLRQVGRPDLLVVRCTTGEASLWANGVKVAALPVDSTSVTNTAPIRIAMYGPGVAAWPGHVQSVMLFGGLLRDSDMTKFAAAAPPIVVKPPVEPDACLARTTGKLVVPPTDNSTYRVTVEPKTRFDAYRGGKHIVWTRALTTGDAQIPIVISGATDGCWTGGAVIGTQDRNLMRSYDTFGNSPAILIGWDAACDRFLLQNVRIDNFWDAIKIGSKGGTNAEITVADCFASHIRDDFIENDDHKKNVHLRRLLVDGCSCFFSSRNTGSGSAAGYVSDIDGCLVRQYPMPLNIGGPSPGCYYVFKLDARAERFLVTNSVFAFSQGVSGKEMDLDGGAGGSPFYDISPARYDKLLNPSDTSNTVCALSNFRIPGNWWIPSGWRVLEGPQAEQFWADLKSDWLKAHPNLYQGAP